MDLNRIIQELMEERDRVESLIVSLEAVNSHRTTPAPKRRGRKSMDQDAREEVSERMRKYWARRRAEKSASLANREGEGSTASSGNLETLDSFRMHSTAA